jgi:hypothetical protein
MYGRIYYSPSIYYTGYSELFNCIDLKTGAFLYQVNTTAVTGARNLPAFGYYYDQDDVNEHGIQNAGWLFTSNYGVGYQPEYGYAELHLANAPSAAPEIQGPSGEDLRYSLTRNTTGTWLAQWNSSRVIPVISSGAAPVTTSYEANVPITPARPSTSMYWNGTFWSTTANTNWTALNVNQVNTTPSYDFNMSLTYNGSPFVFSTAPTIGAAKDGDIVWGYNATWPTGTSAPSYTYNDNVTVWAIDINPADTTYGTVLYLTNIQTDLTPTTDNQNLLFEHADANEGVFIALEIPSQTFYVWNMHTGNLMFTTDSQTSSLSPFGYYTWPSLISGTQVKTGYGMMYTGGYSGTISAYSLNETGTNQSPVWRYSVFPPGTAGIIKSSPGMMTLLADGKLYVGTHEHSAETPLEAGNNMKVLNATDGTLIWEMAGWVYPSAAAVADGCLVYLNNYDMQLYSIGQGPSALTVTAPQAGVTLGNSLIISGTVTDVSAGTQQTAVKADFPNGVPAVSDASQSAWMEYVYMQKIKPSNTTGVNVSIDAVDSNNNVRHLGDTTSDSSGMFSFQYTPDIAGKFTVTATFAGSNSYYGSSSETSFVVDPAHPTQAPQATQAPGAADQFFVPAIAGLFVAVIVVGLLIILVLRKRP